MAVPAEMSKYRPSFGRLGELWKQWRDRRAVLDALAQCGRAEIDRMARDVGIRGADLCVLAGKWPESATLLARRITALGFDGVELGRTQPQVVRDLQRVCSICMNKRACEHDLDRTPSSPAWRDYCANADTFAAVSSESPRSRVED